MIAGAEQVTTPGGLRLTLLPPTLRRLLYLSDERGGLGAQELCEAVMDAAELRPADLGPDDELYVAGWALRALPADDEARVFAAFYGRDCSQRLGVRSRLLAFDLDYYLLADERDDTEREHDPATWFPREDA